MVSRLRRERKRKEVLLLIREPGSIELSLVRAGMLFHYDRKAVKMNADARGLEL